MPEKLYLRPPFPTLFKRTMDFQIPDKRQYIVLWLDIEQTLAIAGEEDDSSLLQSAKEIPI